MAQTRFGYNDTWLRVFLAVASGRSFTTAAESTGLSQPTISQQIKHLEQWLGVSLFVRHGRGVVLTDAGTQLHERIAPAMAAIDAALVTMSRHVGVTEGTLRIASVHTINAYLLPAVIRDYTGQRPDATVRVLCRGSAEVAALIERRQADVGVVYDSMVTSAALTKRPLFRERMALYLPEGGLGVTGQRSVHIDTSLPLVIFPPGYALRHLLERHYPGRLNIVAEVETLDAMLRLVGAGAGAAILPDRLRPDELVPVQVHRVPLAAPVPVREVVAITHCEVARSPLMMLFEELVLAHAGRMGQPKPADR